VGPPSKSRRALEPSWGRGPTGSRTFLFSAKIPCLGDHATRAPRYGVGEGVVEAAREDYGRLMEELARASSDRRIG
jgi:hypothetical protein